MTDVPAGLAQIQPRSDQREGVEFQRLLTDLRSCVQEPRRIPSKAGRPRLSVCDMLFCATFKVYSTVSARCFMCDLTDAHAKEYIPRLPHYNSIFNYFEMPELTPCAARPH